MDILPASSRQQTTRTTTTAAGEEAANSTSSLADLIVQEVLSYVSKEGAIRYVVYKFWKNDPVQYEKCLPFLLPGLNAVDHEIGSNIKAFTPKYFNILVDDIFQRTKLQKDMAEFTDKSRVGNLPGAFKAMVMIVILMKVFFNLSSYKQLPSFKFLNLPAHVLTENILPILQSIPNFALAFADDNRLRNFIIIMILLKQINLNCDAGLCVTVAGYLEGYTNHQDTSLYTKRLYLPSGKNGFPKKIRDKIYRAIMGKSPLFTITFHPHPHDGPPLFTLQDYRNNLPLTLEAPKRMQKKRKDEIDSADLADVAQKKRKFKEKTVHLAEVLRTSLTKARNISSGYPHLPPLLPPPLPLPVFAAYPGDYEYDDESEAEILQQFFDIIPEENPVEPSLPVEDVADAADDYLPPRAR